MKNVLRLVLFLIFAIQPMAGLYIHVPFCKQACHYCDFHFSTQQRHVDEMLLAMQREIGLQSSYLNGPLKTIYLGGGTPSLLSEDQLKLLFLTINERLDTTQVEEITLEANPDDIDDEKLDVIQGFGVNRLSLGIQSFDDNALRLMNRAHDSHDALRCLELIKKSGIDNVSVDLIHSIPNQELGTWLKSLDRLLDFKPQHISAYTLTIEEKTVFGKWVKQKKLIPSDEAHSAQQFEALMDRLEEAGYEQYEISNFCLPGYHSKHNASYWRGVPYLGIGPSAHSFNGSSRQANVRNNAHYVKAISAGSVPFELERLSRENKINEFIYTSLRTKWGCSLAELKGRFNYDIMADHTPYIEKLLEKGFVEMEDQTLRLSKRGRLLADQIAMDLFLPA